MPFTKISSVLLLSLLVGCVGDEPEPTPDTDTDEEPTPSTGATFADATDDELVAAAAAGVGYLPVIAWSSTIPGIIDSIASENECPTLSTDDAGAQTYTADACTGPSGQRYDGAFVGHNLPELFSEEDPNRDPMSITFDGWAVDTLVVGGTVWQSEAMPSSAYRTKADLDVTMAGLPTVSTQVDLACSLDEDAASTCTSATAAAFEVEGLGTFTAKGPWTMSAEGLPTGTITLIGADTLVLDLDGMDTETGCIPSKVDGQAIADICIGALVTGPGDGPGPGEDASFTGSALLVSSDALDLSTWSLGGVASVDAELVVDGSDAELHTLSYVGLNDLDEDEWAMSLTEGVYASGISTALDPFANTDAIAVKLRALDAEGEVVACAFAGTVTGMPEEYFSWDECPW